MARPKNENPKFLVKTALAALVKAEGNFTQAARDTGVSRTTLIHRVQGMGPQHPGVKVRSKNAVQWAAFWEAKAEAAKVAKSEAKEAAKAARAEARTAAKSTAGGGDTSSALIDGGTEAETVEFLRAELKRIKGLRSRGQRNELAIVEAVTRVWESDATRIRLPGNWKPADPDRRRKLDTEFITLSVSDLQGGKITPTYDVAMMNARCDLLLDKYGSITDRRRAHAVVDKAVMFFIGDIVEGEQIFGGQQWEIETGVYTQMKILTETCARMVLRAARIYPDLEVVWLSGNHGRIGMKNQPSSPKTNWDRVTGDMTRNAVHLALAKNGIKDPEKQIPFKIVGDWYDVTRLPGGWGLFSTHGDYLTGGGSPNAIMKAFSEWAGTVEEPWDYGQCGHFHNPMNLPVAGHRRCYVNGATESSDGEFCAARIRKSSIPGQWMHIWNEEHGIISDNLIHLVPRRPHTELHTIDQGLRGLPVERPRDW